MSIKQAIQGLPDSPTVKRADNDQKGIKRDYDQKAIEMADAAVVAGAGKGISLKSAKEIADSLFDGNQVRLTPVESRTFIRIASEYKFESPEVRKAFIDSVLEGDKDPKKPLRLDPKALNLPFTRDLTKLNLDALLKAAESISNTAPKYPVVGENQFAGVIDAAASKQIIEMLKPELSKPDKRKVAYETAAYLFDHCKFESTTDALLFKQAIFGFQDHKPYRQVVRW